MSEHNLTAAVRLQFHFIGNKYYIIDLYLRKNNIGDEGATAIENIGNKYYIIELIWLYKLVTKQRQLQKHWKQILHYRSWSGFSGANIGDELLEIKLVTKAQRQLQKHWKQILHYRSWI